MTPLAHRIVKELLLPPRKRTMVDQFHMMRMMDDVHCFEVSEIYDAAIAMLKPGPADRLLATADNYAFLPAPKTWIEWKADDGLRSGLLLVEQSGFADVFSAIELADGQFSGGEVRFQFGLPASGGHRGFRLVGDPHKNREHLCGAMWMAIIQLLAFINTPRIIGRRQYMPHRGLQRSLIASQKSIGRFPLHAWTEIKLEVSPPVDASDEAPAEGHLTGRRALHFCRAHLRIRNGRVELVRAHWRGDDALGIKRSRYAVVPPKSGIAA